MGGLFAVLALLLPATGCRKALPDIAVIPRTTATLLWEPMHLGVAEAARQAGLHLYWNAPADEGDAEKQISLFDACRQAGYRGFIFAPIETLAARTVVLETVAHRKPVVVVDDEFGPAPGPYLSYVENDEAIGANLAAAHIAALLPRGGSIAIVGINTRLESGVSREEQFEKALARRAPGVRILVRRFGDPVVTHQQQIAAQILHGPKHIDALIAMTATATRGAFYAKISSEPHSAIPLVGFDQEMLLPIQTGDVDAVVMQDTRQIGALALRNLNAMLRGEQAPGLTLVAPLLVTRATLNQPAVARQWVFADYDWSQQ
jgi:ribose transport system substrate-binding protein